MKVEEEVVAEKQVVDDVDVDVDVVDVRPRWPQSQRESLYGGDYFAAKIVKKI